MRCRRLGSRGATPSTYTYRGLVRSEVAAGVMREGRSLLR
jgi:hypothetical protein